VLGGLLLGKSGGGSGSRSGAFAALQGRLPLIERRVEDIRERGFRTPLRPIVVSGAQARQAGLADLDRVEPRSEQSADQQLLRMLGLIPAGANLRAIQASIFEDQVAGYYDPHTRRLALVRDATGSSEAIAEITLAHELTHALDDQVFGLHDVSGATSDRALAYTALVEGDATLAMSQYAQRFISGAGLLGAALSSSSGSSTASLPPYIESSLEFPYLNGESFVSALYDVAKGWKLVDFAFEHRPPISTEQVIHPLKYEADEKPLDVPLNTAPLLPGFQRTMNTTLGEFVTEQLLQRRGLARDVAERAAAGWGGDAVELWQSGRQNVLVAAWRWDTPQDAAEFESALRSAKFGTPSAIDVRDGVVRLVLAPSAEQAQQIALARS
jgi:hypothetical protein